MSLTTSVEGSRWKFSEAEMSEVEDVCSGATVFLPALPGNQIFAPEPSRLLLAVNPSVKIIARAVSVCARWGS